MAFWCENHTQGSGVRHKDGSVRICPSPSVITFAKTQGRGQARIPREAEKYLKSKYKAHFAEGYGRATTQDYLHFLRIARGSVCELETQLALAEDLGLCGREASSKVAATLQEVIRLLQGLVAALERRTER